MQSGDLYGRSDDRRLASLAFRQHGVISVAQLKSLGYTERKVRIRTTRGSLLHLHRGVYAVGHARLTARGRWMAAVLACGPGAALSHGAAAALHDLRTIPGGAVDVTAATRHALKGIRCHYATAPLHREDVTEVDAIPVTTLERTHLDLAEILHPSGCGPASSSSSTEISSDRNVSKP